MKHDLTALANLEIETHEETIFGNYVIKVEQDEDTIDGPRDWDNLGTMVCWNRNYTLGDVDGNREYESREDFWLTLAGIEVDVVAYATPEQVERAERIAYEKFVILPLYLYDHSGITMNTTGFSCGWDSGQVGYIYVSLEDIRKEYNVQRVSKVMRKKVEGYLKDEVTAYDDFLTGNVWYYNITRHDDDGEEVDIDSCGGYYGDPEGYMFGEIKSLIAYDIEQSPRQLELGL